MPKPDYEGAVYNTEFPVHANNDGKDYVIFQLLNAEGVAVDPIFYRDFALDGSLDIVATLIKAYMDRRKLKVFLEPGTQAYVKSVRLGESHGFPGRETLYAGKPR